MPLIRLSTLCYLLNNVLKDTPKKSKFLAASDLGTHDSSRAGC